MFAVFSSRLQDIVSYTTCVLYLQKPNSIDVEAVHVSGRNAERLKGASILLGSGITGWVVSNRQPMYNCDPRLDMAAAHVELDTPYCSVIAVPLLKGDEVLGALTLYSNAPTDDNATLVGAFTKKHGIKLGFMSFFIKATVEALQAVPSINGRIEGDDFIQNNYYDIGVAVGTERGLVVPVVRDADKKSFADLERDISEYATRAREGKIKIEDLQGGTFTISNGGVYGSLMGTPILNPPQSGILGMHAIQQRPVAIKSEVVVRPMMYLALSYDHRAVDGKEAVTFLVKVKECIENPKQLGLEI
jgi:2-oxoglutarate dehydrogenase E2 component (dihydrolipoamide succinyltransferase)